MEQQTKGMLCHFKQPGTPKFWPPLRPLLTSPNPVRFNKACDHCAVTISHTCCWQTRVTGTLLTLMPCGTSADEASSIWSTSEDHFGGEKPMLEVVSHKPHARGEGDAQPLHWPLHNLVRKHSARDTSIRLAICFCPLIKLSTIDERLQIFLLKKKKKNVKYKHSQHVTCTPTC